MVPGLRKLAIVVISAAGLTSPISANRAAAQSYPIDCAILLCLSGGWPASEPCARARAEFIRRITPWPVEPPLQIWRCPMGATLEQEGDSGSGLELIDVMGQREKPRLFQSAPREATLEFSTPSFSRGTAFVGAVLGDSTMLQLVQGRADIDISGPEFNFVRSIRVFDVRYASQRLVGEAEVCRRYASVYLGRYGMQGDFSWRVSSPSDLPPAHEGLEGWGGDCPRVANRSVFVDWRDFEGNYGFEQVDY
ncbi:hypothetical protein [Roseovarius indicus]|nr:hypothetical protein [Roseovarius indicus]QEW29516.1 hypothetical protein RIdsm_05361 [Roseovarius indicus]SFE89038.1 hypothetical protein SAMN04488031_1402 [Roseovarius indicus]